MNFKVLFGIFMILLLVVGCSKPAEKQTQPEVKPEQPSGESVQPEVQKSELSQELKDILAKNANIKNFEYIYSENLADTSTYSVLGDKIKIAYGSRQMFNNFVYYTIYIDGAAKKEYLVCDVAEECKGVKALEITYGTFGKESPLEVIRRLDNGEITERTQIDNKNTVVVAYTNSDGDAERIWIWDFRGMPLKREMNKAGVKTTIAYDKMVINSLSEQDVTLPKGIEMV